MIAPAPSRPRPQQRPWAASSDTAAPHQPSVVPTLLRRWRFSRWQWAVLALATIAPIVVTAAIAAGASGLISVEDMIDLALLAGEDGGMVTFGALFLASPVQWANGRTQVAVRKYLGIVFYLLAASNGAMFVIESGVAAAFGAPFLIAGLIALVVALPLFLTSNRWSQRALGMRRWRFLHRLTYVVAIALVAHVALIGDFGPGAVLIVAGFIARVPSIRRRLMARGRRGTKADLSSRE